MEIMGMGGEIVAMRGEDGAGGHAGRYSMLGPGVWRWILSSCGVKRESVLMVYIDILYIPSM